MSRIGPLSSAPQLVERKAGLVDMMVRDQKLAKAFAFWGARTLDDAYGDPEGVTGDSFVGGAGPVSMFSVNKSGQFRSPSIVQRRWSWYGENLKNMSRVAFNVDDFVASGLPSDLEVAYVRVQENRITTGSQASLGSINLSTVGATDTVLIAGILFTAIAGAGTPAAQTFDGSAGGATAATELIAAINEGTTSQPLILAAAPVGVTVAASPGAAADQVLLTASVVGADGNQITLSSTGGITVSGSALAGGGSFLSVLGPVNAGDPILGPIYAVPTPEFFGTVVPILTLQGSAPANTGCAGGQVPVLHEDLQDPNPMHIILPRSTNSITITNLSTTETLLVSTGLGATMVEVGPADDPVIVFGAFKEIVVAGGDPTAAVPFSVYAVVALSGTG